MRCRVTFCAALALTVLDAGRPALAADCSTPYGTEEVNALLAALTPALNSAWPSYAKSAGLDPWKDVYDGKVNISCRYGGDEYCADKLMICDKFYIEVRLSELDGLSNMQFKELQVKTLKAAAGTQQCPYDKKASGGSYSCSYSGDGTGRATLKSKITATLDKLKVKIRCEDMFTEDHTYTLFDGSAKCSASKANGHAIFDHCGGTCTTGSPAANLSFMEVDDLDLDLSDVSCDVKPDYSTTSWIAEVLVPDIEDAIVKEVEGPIKNALNGLLDNYIPYPSLCSN